MRAWTLASLVLGVVLALAVFVDLESHGASALVKKSRKKKKAKAPPRECLQEAVECEADTDCCYPMECKSPGQNDNGDDLPNVCASPFSIFEKYAMTSAFFRKHKPWFEEEELRGFVDSNKHAFYKLGMMMDRKHGEKLWDFWDAIDFDEQEMFLDEARVAYPDPLPEVVDTIEFNKRLPDKFRVEEDGNVML